MLLGVTCLNKGLIDSHNMKQLGVLSLHLDEMLTSPSSQATPSILSGCPNNSPDEYKFIHSTGWKVALRELCVLP